MDRVPWARGLAARLLAESLPRRWQHVQGVGRKAESLAHVVGADFQTLVCAAWLHDIGYATPLVQTGLHSLDGARYLRDVERVDDQLCRLVAHHSFASIEARHRGLSHRLLREFATVDGVVADALTYCDMTTGPDGHDIDVAARLDEILSRYGPESIVGESIREARPRILQSVRKILELK